jgi:hypothetical protein
MKKLITRWEDLDNIPKDREEIKSRELYDKLYLLSSKERKEEIEKMADDNIPFVFDDIEGIVFYNLDNYSCILVVCKTRELSFDIFKEETTFIERKSKKIEKAYNYVKENVRNIYKKHFGERWNGRFGKEARKQFFKLFGDGCFNREINEGLSEQESFEKEMDYLYAPGLTIYMLMLQDDFMVDERGELFL